MTSQKANILREAFRERSISYTVLTQPATNPVNEGLQSLQQLLAQPNLQDQFHPIQVAIGHQGASTIPDPDHPHLVVSLTLNSWDVPYQCRRDGSLDDETRRELLTAALPKVVAFLKQNAPAANPDLQLHWHPGMKLAPIHWLGTSHRGQPIPPLMTCEITQVLLPVFWTPQ